MEAVSKPEQLAWCGSRELAPLLDDASAMLEAATRRDSGALLHGRTVGKLVGEGRERHRRAGLRHVDVEAPDLASLEPLLWPGAGASAGELV